MGIVVSISVTLVPHNISAKTLSTLTGESDLLNMPHFDVGRQPFKLTYSDDLYVANYGSDDVSIINPKTMKVSNIPVGDGPVDVAVSDKQIYVANYGSDNVSVINGTDNMEVTVGDGPVSISALPSDPDKQVYVANYGSDNVSVINGTDNSLITNIPVGDGPVAIGSIFTITSTNVTHSDKQVYVANYGSDNVSVINGTDNSLITNIPVGDGPVDVKIAPSRLYIANKDSDNISVINPNSYSLITNIPVGDGPVDVELSGGRNRMVYVANKDSDNISVINPNSYSLITNIPVGDGPEVISIVRDENHSRVYAANSQHNVYVINGTDNSLITNIHVGDFPENLPENLLTRRLPVPLRDVSKDTMEVDSDNTVYVGNYRSGTVSVIDDKTHKVIAAGVSFDVNPFNAGRVICNNTTVPTNQYYYMDFRTQCMAQANEGFRYRSWIENLEGNSSRTIKDSTVPDFPLNVLSALGSALGIIPKDTSANLTVTDFGRFTANFEKVSSSLPPEYWGSLFTVVATALVGTWLIPSVIGWTKSKRQHRSLRQYRKRIDSLNNSKSEDNQVKHETLEELMNELTTAYSRGEINELQHEILKEQILKYHHKTILKRINLLKNVSNRNNDEYVQALDNTSKQLKDAYSEGKINIEHYQNLKSEISVLYEEMHMKRIDSLNDLPIRHDSKDDRLMNKIKNDIEDAYVKGKITDQHYNLLNKKIQSFVNTTENKWE